MHVARGQQYHAVSYHRAQTSRCPRAVLATTMRSPRGDVRWMESITNHEQTSAGCHVSMEMEDRTTLQGLE